MDQSASQHRWHFFVADASVFSRLLGVRSNDCTPFKLYGMSGYCSSVIENMERETGLEPATSSLGSYTTL